LHLLIKFLYLLGNRFKDSLKDVLLWSLLCYTIHDLFSVIHLLDACGDLIHFLSNLLDVCIEVFIDLYEMLDLVLVCIEEILIRRGRDLSQYLLVCLLRQLHYILVPLVFMRDIHVSIHGYLVLGFLVV